MSRTQTNENSLKNLTYNHEPLSETKVREEFKKRGYTIIDYTYKNNLTRMNCYDSEGYIVKVSYASFSHEVKTYMRFSVTCNEENFIYNTNLYAKKNNMKCEVLEWRKSLMKCKRNHHIDIKCRCECGEEYWCNFNQWKMNLKGRCNKCTHLVSNLAKKTKEWLDNNNIEYIQEYRFQDCKDQKPLPFDFYLPKNNICIEVDGEQHYYAYSFGYKKIEKDKPSKRENNAQKDFEIRKRHDLIKDEYCLKNNIKLIRLKYNLFRNSKNEPLYEYKKILQKEIYNC
jgi:very-short-patch-repair endonuclease